MTHHQPASGRRGRVLPVGAALAVVLRVLTVVAVSLASENIRLSHVRPASAVPLQVLPNTDKLGVYIASACEGCGSDNPGVFAARDFRRGQAEQLMEHIEKTTGVVAPEGKNAVERLNGLLRDQGFAKKLLELHTEETVGSPLFAADDFQGAMSPRALVEAIRTEGRVVVPALNTPLACLNAMLANEGLYNSLTRRPEEAKDIISTMGRGQPLSPQATQALNRSLVATATVREFTSRLHQGQHLGPLEITLLNRLLIEANYPAETPKLTSTVALAGALRNLQTRGFVGAEEIRSLLEERYLQETPKRLSELYERVRQLLPTSVQDQVYVANGHLFAKDGTSLHFAFSTDDKMYYGKPAWPGFDLMVLDANTTTTRTLAHLYVGDFPVPHLRISTISVSPDNRKIALCLTSDPITLFGDSYHDIVVLHLAEKKMTVYDLGNTASYGGWWSPASDMFYTSCPLTEHRAPRSDEVCGLPLASAP